MKLFGWTCFYLGLAILAIGLPLVFIFGTTPMLIGKILVAAGINLSIGWGLAHLKEKHAQKYCINCGNPIGANRFCINCGLQLRRLR